MFMNYKLGFFLSLSLILNIITFRANAHLEKGGESHGGNAVVCFDRPYFLKGNKIDSNAKIIKQPELKDFWEYSQLSSFPLINLKEDFYPEMPYKNLVEEVINQIGNVDPVLFYKLNAHYNNFKNYFRFVREARLNRVDEPDSTLEPDESNYCYKVQLAEFKKDTLPGSGHTIINGTIFDLMSARDQAGLILHEFFWLEITKTKKKVKDLSDYVRNYTFLVFTKNFLNEPFFDFFYVKNLYLVGIYDILPRTQLDFYLINRAQYQVIAPANYSFLNSEKFKVIEWQFRGSHKFHLPNEIWEIGKFKDITPRPSDDFKVCISLEHEDLKNYGSCLK